MSRTEKKLIGGVKNKKCNQIENSLKALYISVLQKQMYFLYYDYNSRGVFGLELISKEQMQELIDKKILRIKDGRYENLMILNKGKKGKRKRRYVPWTVAKLLTK